MSGDGTKRKNFNKFLEDISKNDALSIKMLREFYQLMYSGPYQSGGSDVDNDSQTLKEFFEKYKYIVRPVTRKRLNMVRRDVKFIGKCPPDSKY